MAIVYAQLRRLGNAGNTGSPNFQYACQRILWQGKCLGNPPDRKIWE